MIAKDSNHYYGIPETTLIEVKCPRFKHGKFRVNDDSNFDSDQPFVQGPDWKFCQDCPGLGRIGSLGEAGIRIEEEEIQISE